MSFWTKARDAVESIAPTALGAVFGGPFGGPAGGALAGQLAKPFESKSAQSSDLQKAADVADIGLGAYGAYKGLTGGNAFGWGAGTSTAGTKDTSTLGTMGKYAMPLAMGLSTVASMGKKPTDYTPQLNALVAPAQGAANTLLSNYSAGKLNPADQVQIDSWEQQQIAQTKDFYARSGQGDSTAMQQQVGQIQAQAQGMRSQALTGMLNSGLQAIGVAAGPVTTAIQAQIAQDQQMQAAQSQLFMTLAMFGSRA